MPLFVPRKRNFSFPNVLSYYEMRLGYVLTRRILSQFIQLAVIFQKSWKNIPDQG